MALTCTGGCRELRALYKHNDSNNTTAEKDAAAAVLHSCRRLSAGECVQVTGDNDDGNNNETKTNDKLTDNKYHVDDDTHSVSGRGRQLRSKSCL